MSKEHVHTTIALAKKAATMAILQTFDRVRMPRLHPSTEALQLYAGLHISSVEVQGRENLANALIKAEEEDRPVIFTVRHRADADSPLVRRGLTEAGRKDVADRTLWVAGVNMLTRLYILPFSFSEEAVYTATPEDLTLAKKLVKESEETPLRSLIARKILSIFNKQNEKAKEEVLEARKHRKYLTFYPEARRSRDGFLGRAPRTVSAHLPRRESEAAVVISIVTVGTDEFNKPGKYNPRDLLPGNRHDVSLIIGKHYLSNQAWEIARAMGSRDVTVADVVMAFIYATHPEGVRPEDERLYQNIMSQYIMLQNIMLQSEKRESGDRRVKTHQVSLAS